jgi:hypothetical protein
MAAQHYRSAKLVFGWSFYRQGTSGGSSSADEFLTPLSPGLEILTHGSEGRGRRVKDWQSSSPDVEPCLSWMAWSHSKIRQVHKKDAYVNFPCRPLFLAVICGCNAGLFREALHEVYVPQIQRGNASLELIEATYKKNRALIAARRPRRVSAKARIDRAWPGYWERWIQKFDPADQQFVREECARRILEENVHSV